MPSVMNAVEMQAHAENLQARHSALEATFRALAEVAQQVAKDRRELETVLREVRQHLTHSVEVLAKVDAVLSQCRRMS